MLYALLKLLHLLAVVFWVGGMAFVMIALRPSLPLLPPPQRLRLMDATLGRFLNAAALAVLVVLGSGTWMLADMLRLAAAHGGVFVLPLGWASMIGLGLLMAVIFAYVRWACYPPLRRAVAAEDWPAGGAALGRIRHWVTLNLGLGLLAIAAVVLDGA